MRPPAVSKPVDTGVTTNSSKFCICEGSSPIVPASSGVTGLLKNSWIIFCLMKSHVEPPTRTWMRTHRWLSAYVCPFFVESFIMTPSAVSKPIEGPSPVTAPASRTWLGFVMTPPAVSTGHLRRPFASEATSLVEFFIFSMGFRAEPPIRTTRPVEILKESVFNSSNRALSVVACENRVRAPIRQVVSSQVVMDHLLLGGNSCGTVDKKTLLRETHGNSKTVHFPSSNRALDNEREKISTVACKKNEFF